MAHNRRPPPRPPISYRTTKTVRAHDARKRRPMAKGKHRFQYQNRSQRRMLWGHKENGDRVVFLTNSRGTVIVHNAIVNPRQAK